MTDGVLVVHRAFGTGRVDHVSDFKGVQAAWVDFDRGDRKMLDAEYAAAHIRVRTEGEATTPADPTIRCDICGARPVVATVASAAGAQRSARRTGANAAHNCRSGSACGRLVVQAGKVPFRVLAIICLCSMATVGCSDDADGQLARCRELEPNVSAEQAWDDIEALHETVAQFLALDCERALSDAAP